MKAFTKEKEDQTAAKHTRHEGHKRSVEKNCQMEARQIGPKYKDI